MRGFNNCWRLYGAIILIAIAGAASAPAAPSGLAQKVILECDRELLYNSLDTALAEEGTLERSNRNDGDVTKYIKLLGLKEGAPYCAAGQYYCFYKSAIALKAKTETIPVKKTASSVALAQDALAKGIKSSFRPARHDIVIWRKAGSQRGHTERIFKTLKAGNVMTIAFNVKKGGKEGVFIKKRNLLYPLSRMSLILIIGFKEK